MLKRSIAILSIVAFAAFIVVSCGDDKKEEKEKDNGKKDTVEVQENETNDALQGKLELFILNDFFPIEVFKKIKEAGAEYNPGILNSVDNVENYTSRHLKAINLGIYGADLNYSVCNDQAQVAYNYLATSAKMAEELDVPMAFDKDLMNSYTENIDNPEELTMLIVSAYDNAAEMLKTNEQLEMSALIIAGSWFEGLYLTVENYNGDEDSKNYISQQSYQLEKILEIFVEFEEVEFLKNITADFNKIKDFYSGVADANALTDEEIAGLKELLNEVRTQIISI